MAVDKETVEKIARLASIALSEEEKEHMTKDLNRIFDWIDTLRNVDVPDEIATKEQVMHLRADEVTVENQQEEILANAPKKGHNMFMVPKFIDS